MENTPCLLLGHEIKARVDAEVTGGHFTVTSAASLGMVLSSALSARRPPTTSSRFPPSQLSSWAPGGSRSPGG